jgi:hypothetical protein
MRNKEVREALTDALEFLEGLGYTGGDVHDDLAAAIEKLERVAPKAMRETISPLEGM